MTIVHTGTGHAQKAFLMNYAASVTSTSVPWMMMNAVQPGAERRSMLCCLSADQHVQWQRPRSHVAWLKCIAGTRVVKAPQDPNVLMFVVFKSMIDINVVRPGPCLSSVVLF